MYVNKKTRIMNSIQRTMMWLPLLLAACSNIDIEVMPALTW